LIEQSRHLLPHGGRTTLYAGTKTNTAPSGGDVKKVTSGARCSANVGLWHGADIKLRPLFGRYGVESGQHLRGVSLSAFDAVDGAHSAASVCQRVVALKRTTMRGAVHGRG
jgi:hypothetical protein